MASGYEVVRVVHAGGKEQVRSEWKTIRAVFHNFEALPHDKGDFTSSPVIECHGYKWMIDLYPGGDEDSKDDCIALFLSSLSCSSSAVVKAAFTMSIPSAAGTSAGFWRKRSTMDVFTATASSPGFDFAPRSSVLDASNNFLVDGNLVVEVDIQAMVDKPPSTPTWTPTNTVCSDMLKMLKSNDPDDFDITFQVGADDTKEFHAHRNIPKARAPVFADFIADYPDSNTNISIKDVEPDVFRMLLRFIYGGELPSNDVLGDQARPIIQAADKYGCTGLKLAAESKMAAASITTENAAELILFADATNCAMLKESAMEYFVPNAEDVMASEGYKQVAESPAIMGEMMAAVVAGNKKRSAGPSDDNDRDYKRMRVATLRQKLDKKGLDVDGSKEMLVSRLEEAARAEDNATFVMVSGAGLSNVNGKYRRTEELCDGVPVYRMEGSWQEIIGSFALYQCSLGAGLKEWFIAYVRDGTKPGTSKDVDFYSSTDSADDSSPPTTGWHVLPKGEGPPPAVQMHSLADHS